MSEFPVRRVDRSRAQSVEQLGSKPKFWFREGKRRLLFKADNRGTGEDWAEIIACHLCALLGLPHVDYELASECEGGRIIRPGVVCETMAPRPVSLVLGNELLMAADPNYPGGKQFKVPQHTIDAVAEAISKLAPPAQVWMTSAPKGIESALDVFAGYIMLDAWIANQDRHHENWGALREGNEQRLAPTFDHGASLGRNLLDEERAERLTTQDQNRMIRAFAERGRSTLYGAADDVQPLRLLAAFRAFGQRVPNGKNAWLDRLQGVNREAILGILERVPGERMSETSKEFTLELLLTNQQRLLQ